MDPNSTWFPELLGRHPVPLTILQVLLVCRLTHPLQAVVTEEPLGGEKREASGDTRCQLSPFPGTGGIRAAPHFRPQPMGPWGMGSGLWATSWLWPWEAPSSRA